MTLTFLEIGRGTLTGPFTESLRLTATQCDPPSPQRLWRGKPAILRCCCWRPGCMNLTLSGPWRGKPAWRKDGRKMRGQKNGLFLIFLPLHIFACDSLLHSAIIILTLFSHYATKGGNCTAHGGRFFITRNLCKHWPKSVSGAFLSSMFYDNRPKMGKAPARPF